MTTLEYIGKYNNARREIDKLSDEELESFIREKKELIDHLRIQLSAAENALRERGNTARLKLRENDLKYVPPAEFHRNKLTKYLERKGESAQKIADFQKKLESINFDDIL